MHEARDRAPGVVLVKRVITRPSEAGGEDFEGVSETEFLARLAQGEFALHWQAHGLYYGIPAKVREAVEQDKTVLFNGSRAMLTEAAQAFPGLRVLHITATDDTLAARLKARGRESDADIARRLERARLPLPDGLNITRIDNSGALERAFQDILTALSPASDPV